MWSHNWFYRQNWYPTKSKMATGTILKSTFLAIRWPLLHIFAPNLMQMLKTGSRSQIYRQNSHKSQKTRWWRPPFWNQLIGHNPAIFEPICTKFDTETENEVPDQILPTKLIFHKIQDSGSCHIEIQLFSHNRTIIAYIYTKFNTVAKNQVPQPDFPSKFTYCKNPRWRPSLLWNQLNGDNCVNIERIRSKFNIETGNHVLELALPSKLR